MDNQLSVHNEGFKAKTDINENSTKQAALWTATPNKGSLKLFTPEE